MHPTVLYCIVIEAKIDKQFYIEQLPQQIYVEQLQKFRGNFITNYSHCKLFLLTEFTVDSSIMPVTMNCAINDDFLYKLKQYFRFANTYIRHRKVRARETRGEQKPFILPLNQYLSYLSLSSYHPNTYISLYDDERSRLQVKQL